MAKGIWRALVITHRYLGILGCVLMVMWFFSGIVMMYVPFPNVLDEARRQTLAPISWQACCQFGEGLASDNEAILLAQLESLNGVPALRLQRPGRRDNSLDLAHGTVVRVDAESAQAIVLDAALRVIGRPAAIVETELAQTDQWSVGRLQRDRPLYRFAFDDPERTNIYVSSTGGQVVHWTTVTQRFWNWLGTIPHFIYFVDLRSDVELWSQIVIYTSLLGTFLTVLGLYLGIAQIRSSRRSKISPYRGWFYWHHVAGLVFGLVAITWAFSGMVSMNPWGFLEGRRGFGEQTRVQGTTPKWSDVRASLKAIRARGGVADAVSLMTAPLAGQLYWLATLRDGKVLRLDAAGNVAVPTSSDLQQTAQRIAGDRPIAEQGLITEEETYYFKRRRDTFVLPAYRIILADEDATRYYLDPTNGQYLQRADSTGRLRRWLFSGLHHIDFFAWLRVRPLWDVVVITLMLGGLAVSATGAYLAFRRLRNDLIMVIRRWRRRRRVAAAKLAPRGATMMSAPASGRARPG
jgi:uncharacterized iron-regulated membrane protein